LGGFGVGEGDAQQADDLEALEAYVVLSAPRHMQETTD